MFLLKNLIAGIVNGFREWENYYKIIQVQLAKPSYRLRDFFNANHL